MSIEQKIAEILAESRASLQEAKVGENDEVKVTHSVGEREDIYTVLDKKTGQKEKYGIHAYFSAGENPRDVVMKQLVDNGVHPAAHEMIRKHALYESAFGLKEETDVGDPSAGIEENPDNARNNVVTQEVGGVDKQPNVVTDNASDPEPSNLVGMKEDVEALVAGENLSEEFKQKAATIFEAAVLSRVKQEVAKLDEAFEVRLQEQVEEIKEGLVEQVDGYLDYVVEQWMTQNEIALERGMKSEILENFVSGLKNLFEEHYIDVPEEKFDVMEALEERVEQLESKLTEQTEVNAELVEEITSYQKSQIVATVSEGMVQTDKEKFAALVEEISFDNAESFRKKAQTIRESYFTTKKATTTVVNSIVTDEPVMIREEKALPTNMKSYLSVLDNLK